jgi:hypothetical protein
LEQRSLQEGDRGNHPGRSVKAFTTTTWTASGSPLSPDWHSVTGRLANRSHESKLGIITRRRILYWLGAMIALLVAGTTIGLIWADTSDAAGLIAVVTNIIGIAGIVFLLITLAVVTRRERQALKPPRAIA